MTTQIEWHKASEPMTAHPLRLQLSRKNGFKETPMLFTGAMVRALLNGTKTQTRRIVKPDSSWTRFYDGDKDAAFVGFNRDAGKGSLWNAGHINSDGTYGRSHWQCGDDLISPNYQESDRVWVKETALFQMCDRKKEKVLHYAADGYEKTDAEVWTPSIFMPRWASRITLEIVSVRIERVQDISGLDAIAEGWPREQELYPDVNTHSKAQDWYHRLWDSINAKKPGCSWDEHPWVFAIEFKRVQL